MTNCAKYDESLRRRGDLTVWISEEALALWAAAPRTVPDGKAVYSDLTIELCLTFGMALKQPLRQAQGLMRSIAELLGVDRGAAFLDHVTQGQWTELASQNSIQEGQTRSTRCGRHRAKDLWRG
jgi:hypothetical protein